MASLVDALRSANALLVFLVAGGGGEVTGHIAFSEVPIESKSLPTPLRSVWVLWWPSLPSKERV